jgi:hypothetical protein
MTGMRTAAARRAVGGLGLGLLLLLLVAAIPLPVGAPHGATGPTAPTALAAPARPEHGAEVLPRSMANPAFLTGGQGRMILVTSDPATVPNEGLRTNITAFLPAQFGPDSSFQVAATEAIGTYDAVFGLFENTQFPPVPFFSVFSNTTDATIHLAYWTNETALSNVAYDFALRPLNGTVWQLTVNGALFGGNRTDATFDFGATSATWSGGISFSEIALYPSTTTAPPSFLVSLAFAVFEGLSWYLPESATVTFGGTPGSAWGVEGRIQHPTLAPGEIVSGTSIPTILNGSLLWTGGPLPVEVVVTVPSTSIGLTTIAAQVEISDPSGAPLPDVSLAWNDALGGNFTPSAGLTNLTGGQISGFSTPNVTASASDLVRAMVTTFGYVGTAGVAVLVAPATQILLRPLAGSLTVAPGGKLAIEFSAMDTNGHPEVGLTVAFVSNTGSITMPYGVTDAQATAVTQFVAPSITTTSIVTASVAGPGAWGKGAAVVAVHPPPASLWDRYGTDVEAGAAIALVALLIVLVVRRRRRRRQSLPSMPIRQYYHELKPASPGPAEPPADVSRTPPGSSSP